MFHFQCPCGADLIFELHWGYLHEVLCPRCLESFTITFHKGLVED